nr:MAG TPA: hypothetical protein [Crassvirales sp.]
MYLMVSKQTSRCTHRLPRTVFVLRICYTI